MTPEDQGTSLSPPAADEAVWRLANAFAGAVTALDVAEGVALAAAPAAGAAFANLAVVVMGTDRVLVFRRLFGSIGSRDLSSDEPACDVIRNGVPLFFGSLEAYRRRYPAAIDLLKSAGLESGATLPVRAADGNTLGALGFGWASPQVFDPEQRRRLELIAELAGLALDRTVAVESWPAQAAELAQKWEEMPDGFCSVDGEFRVTSINLHAASLFDATRHELIGISLFELFPDGPDSGFERQFRTAWETGKPVVFEDYCSRRGSWYEVRAWPGSTGLNVYFSNIDERRASEMERASTLYEVRQANASLSLLAEISARLAGAGSQTEVYERLVRALLGTPLADWCTVVVPRGEALVRVAAAHSDRVLDLLTQRLIGSYPHQLSGPSPGVEVYRSGQPLCFERLAQRIIADLDESASSAAYARSLELLGDGPGLVTPIFSDGRVAAVLTTIRTSGELYTDADVELAARVAERVTGALGDARHVETQRETATALQDASLPKALPRVAGIGLAAGYRAASEGVAVGGDWYDAIETPGGRVAAVVGDVAGHGVGAAALMAQMRNTLRAHLFSQFSLPDSLARLSDQLVLQERGVFATVVCAGVDPATGEVSWVSAGHPAPILLAADGSSVHLEGDPAPPIGWMHSRSPRPAPEHHLTLHPGDRLLLFTDGLIERRGVDIAIGITHLMLYAEQTRGLSAAVACETILSQTTAGAAHEDDICLLILDFRPEGLA